MGTSASDSESPPPIEIPLVLTGQSEVPILFSNWAIVQHQNQEFVITFGQFTPPIITGTPEEQRRQAESTPALPVKVIARVGMTTQRMTELVRSLQENLQNYERRGGGLGQEG